jgi:tRNA(fMet)-specific endonuclease VapC
MSWMLDTDTCIYALKQRAPVLSAMLARPPSRIHVSAIAESELLHGAERSSRPHATLARVEAFLRPLQLLPYGSEAAKAYASLRARLEAKGTPIGPLDLLIAAHALSAGLVLVTNNTREFSRVPGLRLENWAAP